MQDRKTSSVKVSLVELDCNVLRNIIHLLFTAKKKRTCLREIHLTVKNGDAFQRMFKTLRKLIPRLCVKEM